MHVPRAGPAARNLRVPAIISITLEYKMRVINFITNYVGPAGAHFNLTSKSAPQSQSQLELTWSRVESQSPSTLASQFFSFLFFCCRLASEPLPMSLAHGRHTVSHPVSWSVILSVHRAVNHNPFRLPSTYKSNSLSFRKDLWQQ